MINTGSLIAVVREIAVLRTIKGLKDMVTTDIKEMGTLIEGMITDSPIMIGTDLVAGKKMTLNTGEIGTVPVPEGQMSTEGLMLKICEIEILGYEIKIVKAVEEESCMVIMKEIKKNAVKMGTQEIHA